MKQIGFILFTVLLHFNSSFSQTKSEIELLLNEIAKIENSTQIIKTEQTQEILAYGEKSLPMLAELFTDSALTTITSECNNRVLTYGELAIIIADSIKRTPYAFLTGVQNCTLEFCENNPNLIEYYFHWIEKDGGKLFKEKYINWLNSDE